MPRIIDFRVRLPAELRPPVALSDEVTAQYDQVLNLSEKLTRTLADLRTEMDACGVGHALVHAEFEEGDPADAMNETLGRLITDEPERFSGVGTISMQPLDVMRAVEQVDRCGELGFAGVTFQPSFFRIAINDRRLYPVYAKCCELGLFACMHTGINYGVTHPIRNDHPLQLDDVACDFPDLTLIACHAGWPWTAEMVAVARKHPHVFLEFGGLAPKYIGEPGSGWEVVRRFMNSLLAEQVLFGTDWPVMDMERALGEWRAMGLKDHVLEALLGGNAQRLLGDEAEED